MWEDVKIVCMQRWQIYAPAIWVYIVTQFTYIQSQLNKLDIKSITSFDNHKVFISLQRFIYQFKFIIALKIFGINTFKPISF